MKPNNSLNESITKVISPALRQHGFQRQRFTFYYLKNENWGLISFQKSMTQVPGFTRFTVNIGVISDRLLNFFTIPPVNKKPRIEDCHWRLRLGELTHGEDVWWSMENEKPNVQLAEHLLHSIENLAIPEISKYIDDTALRDLWLSGHSPSLTEFERLLNLAVLLKEIGPHDLLKATLDNLKKVSENKRSAYTAEIYIKKLLSQ